MWYSSSTTEDDDKITLSCFHQVQYFQTLFFSSHCIQERNIRTIIDETHCSLETKRYIVLKLDKRRFSISTFYPTSMERYSSPSLTGTCATQSSSPQNWILTILTRNWILPFSCHVIKYWQVFQCWNPTLSLFCQRRQSSNNRSFQYLKISLKNEQFT